MVDFWTFLCVVLVILWFKSRLEDFVWWLEDLWYKYIRKEKD